MCMAAAAVLVPCDKRPMLHSLVWSHVQAALDRKSNKETGPSDPDMVKGWKNFVKPLTDA